MDAAARPFAPTSLADLQNYVGAKFGPGEWVTVTQETINEFAANTGDNAWFHVDVERARREMPDGKTIAHGLLTLALTPMMLGSAMSVSGRPAGGGGRALHYGYDKLRFLAPVQGGARLRLSGVVSSAEPRPQGVLITLKITVELEGSDKPAMIADWLELAFT